MNHSGVASHRTRTNISPRPVGFHEGRIICTSECCFYAEIQLLWFSFGIHGLPETVSPAKSGQEAVIRLQFPFGVAPNYGFLDFYGDGLS